MTDTGVAPFNYHWPVELGLAREGKLLSSWQTAWDIRTVVPGDRSRTFQQQERLFDTQRQAEIVLVRVVNPLSSGKPLRFANREQDADLAGWLTIGRL